MHGPAGYPARPPINSDGIPEELRGRDQWLCWRFGAVRKSGRRAKEPISARTGQKTDATDPRSWVSFPIALEATVRHRLDGVGFGLSRQRLPVVTGVDLDDAYDAETGELALWAGEIVFDLGSYAESSPSGAGVRGFLLSALPGAGVNRKPIELYDDKRFVTVTGLHIPGTPTVLRRDDAALSALYRRLITSPDEPPPE